MNNKYKYRFKTEKEFIKDAIKKNGNDNDWRLVNGLSSFGEMDYLLGNDIDVPVDAFSKSGNVVNKFNIICDGYDYNHWIINPNMLVKERFRPTYKPRKFLY